MSAKRGTPFRPSNKSLELKARGQPPKPVDKMPRFRVVRLVIRAERQIIAAKNENHALQLAIEYARWRPFIAHGSHGDPCGDVTVERIVFERKAHGVKHMRLVKERPECQHVYAPLDDVCIHCRAILPKRERV